MSKQNISVAQFLTLKIDASTKSQTEIASELGYPNPNIITMFKQGRTKVPLAKLADLATVLEIDPVHLLRVVMTEYSPETWKVLERTMGHNVVTETEMKVVRLMREVAGEMDVSPVGADQVTEFKDVVEKWKKTFSAKVIKH